MGNKYENHQDIVILFFYLKLLRNFFISLICTIVDKFRTISIGQIKTFIIPDKKNQDNLYIVVVTTALRVQLFNTNQLEAAGNSLSRSKLFSIFM